MTITSGSFLILDLGLPTVKYFWKGKQLSGIIKVFVYKGISVTITYDINNSDLPVDEMKEYGLKLKGVKL